MKVLIVDDERFIRNGLRTIIEESRTGFTEVFEAANGNDAMDSISGNEIDLVITDIRMPVMDGIALMKAVQDKGYSPEFVILTGYDDFQYAKESIRYGAKAYLLKPVRRSEIYEVLDKIEQEVIKKKNASLEKEKFGSFMSVLREHKLNCLIMGDNPGRQELEDAAGFINSDILNGRYFTAVILKRKEKADRENWNGEVLYEMNIRTFFETLKHPVLPFYSMEGNLVVIAGNMETFLELAAFLKGKGISGYIMGVSGAADGMNNIKKAYGQACEALKYRIVKFSENIITYDDVKLLNRKYSLPLDSLYKVQQLIGTKRVREISEAMDNVFDYRKMLENDIGYTVKLASTAFDYIIEKFSGQMRQQKTDSHGYTFEYLSDIYRFDSVRDYVHTFKKCVFDINDCLLALTDCYKQKSEIDAALDYIRDNYHKDLNLAVVANHVSLNYSYFSNLFSGQIGMGFHDYLKKVRIEKSKKLLLTTEYKINEIAEKVGYKNPKHFATNFRGLTGISPMEYRSRHASGNAQDVETG